MSDNPGTSRLVPTFKLFVNGSEAATQLQTDVINVSVHEDVDVPSMFVLHLKNWDMAQLSVTWVDDDLFSVGNEVEIQMGYVDNLETMMIGEITGLEPEFMAGSPPSVTIRGYDRRHRLMRGRKTRSFTSVKDSDVASQIANDAGLTPDVVDTEVTLDYILQHNQTDLEFLQERAVRVGFEVVVEEKTLIFRPRRNEESEVLTLARDLDLIEFFPRLSTLNQTGQVTVRSWNITDKEAIVGEARAGSENTTMGGTTTGPSAVNSAFGDTETISVANPVFTQAEADRLASERLKEMALLHIVGDGVCTGNMAIRAGSVMALEGLGERFSGRYYITSARHLYAPNQGYRTAFTVRKNAT